MSRYASITRVGRGCVGGLGRTTRGVASATGCTAASVGLEIGSTACDRAATVEGRARAVGECALRIRGARVTTEVIGKRVRARPWRHAAASVGVEIQRVAAAVGIRRSVEGIAGTMSRYTSITRVGRGCVGALGRLARGVASTLTVIAVYIIATVVVAGACATKSNARVNPRCRAASFRRTASCAHFAELKIGGYPFVWVHHISIARACTIVRGTLVYTTLMIPAVALRAFNSFRARSQLTDATVVGVAHGVHTRGAMGGRDGEESYQVETIHDCTQVPYVYSVKCVITRRTRP
jgi:hypothetical protein